MVLPGDALIIDSAGHQAFGPPTIRQFGPPDQGSNVDFGMTVGSTVFSGTYKLAFLTFTTEVIDGTTGTMTDVADAMNAAYGDTIARALPGKEAYTPTTDANGYVQFIGALGAQAIAPPTVVDDTTDGTIIVVADNAGGAPNPVGQIGALLLDQTDFVGYQFTGATNDDPDDVQSAHCWHRVWVAKQLVSDDGLTRVIVYENGSEQIRVESYDDDTRATGFTMTYSNGSSLEFMVGDFGGTPADITMYAGGPIALSVAGCVFSLSAAGVNVTGLPTSDAGLSAGDIWNNGGVLTVV